jgi:hypothetical protein
LPAGFERDSYCTGFEQCETCTGPSSTWTIEKVCAADFAAWLDFNQFLAAAAHARSLGIFLKNNHWQAPQLVSTHDAVLSEQCLQYSECDGYVPFVQAGKPVLLTEYSLATTTMCSKAAALGFSAIKKKAALTATPRTGCCGATPCPASTTCGTGCSFSTASPSTLAPTSPTTSAAPTTPAPSTAAPTGQPTVAAPTTAAPTRKPTKQPTSPTAAPTRKPTKQPTSPTAAPTRKPTNQPTVPTTTVG